MRRLVIGLLAFVAMLTTTAVNAKVLNAQSDLQLAQALSKARNGDTILLAPGNYGQVLIMGGKYNQIVVGNTRISGGAPSLLTDVTIKSQSISNKATIKNIDIRGSNHWSFSDVDIRPGVRGSSFIAVKFNGNNNSLVNSTIIYGNSSKWTKTNWNTRAGRGIWVKGKNSVIQNNYLESVNMGVIIDHLAPNAKVSNNTINGLAGDGIRALGNFGLYQNNLIKNFKDVNNNHDDCLQSFSKANGVIGQGTVKGVTVRGNVCISTEDKAAPFYAIPQGYNAFNGLMTDWLIEDNVVVSSSYHGIALAQAKNTTIRNNTVLDDNPGVNGTDTMWIRINGGQTGTGSLSNQIVDNLANAVINTPFANLSGNVEIGISDYDQWFVDWRNNNYTLKTTAPVLGVGAVLGSVGYQPPGNGNGNGNGSNAVLPSVSAFSSAFVPFDTGLQQLAVPVPLGSVLLLSGLGLLAGLRARSKAAHSQSV